MEDQRWEQTYPGRQQCLSTLRRDVREILVKGDCPETVIDVVVQGMSELGANAVIHTASGWRDGVFVARVFLYTGDYRGPYVWAEVENDGTTDLDLRNVPARHGLDLVRRSATALGTERGPRGRVVYFITAFKPGSSEISQPISYGPPDTVTALALTPAISASP